MRNQNRLQRGAVSKPIQTKQTSKAATGLGFRLIFKPNFDQTGNLKAGLCDRLGFEAGLSQAHQVSPVTA